mgnify:CR=1 FL=1|jgi:hypothetical protein
MSRPNPTKALNGVRSGHICDRCNKRVRTGDLVRAYATYYDEDGWVLRRSWCEECGEASIGEGTDGANGVIVETVFWEHRLVSAKVTNKNQ